MRTTNYFFKALASSALTAALLFNTSCISFDTMSGKDVSQDKIHQNYSIEQEEGSSTVKAIATYRAGGPGGTTLELASPSYCEINGTRTNKVSFLGTSYTANVAPTSAYTWVFVDANERRYINTIEILPIKVVNAPTRLDRSVDYVAAFEGTPLREGDVIRAEFAYEFKSGSGAGSAWRQAQVEGNKLRIRASDLSEVGGGHELMAMKIRFHREFTRKTTEAGSVGGTMTSRYRTSAYAVEVVR